MYCQNCGNKLKGSIKICSKCGFNNKNKKTHKSKNIIFYILILIAVSVVSSYFLIYFGYIKLPKNFESILQKNKIIPEYIGKDLIKGSIRQRNEGARNLEAYIEDERDGKKYRIVKMPDGNWWMAENLNYQKGLILNQRSDYARGMKYENQPNGIGAIGSFWCNDSFFGWDSFSLQRYNKYYIDNYEISKAIAKGKGPIPTPEEMEDDFPGLKGGKDEVEKLETCNKLGALYTWETAVIENGKGEWGNEKYNQYLKNNNICPKGWKLPNDYEWFQMLNKVELDNNGKQNHGEENYTYSGLVAGRLLKINSYVNRLDEPAGNGVSWFKYDDASSINLDYYGFSVLPVGIKEAFASHYFTKKSINAQFWTSTESNDKDAKYIEFSTREPRVFSGQGLKSTGMSIRCIKE